METSTRFSKTELILVVSNCVISKLFLTYPGMFTTLSASSGIILSAVTVIFGWLFIGATAYLYGKRRTDITKMLKNKNFTNILCILLSVMLVINQTLFIKTVTEGLKTSILPDSPAIFITLFFVITVLICSVTGLKAVVRAHSFVVPFTLAMLVLLIISSVKNFDILNIFPVLGNGPEELIYILPVSSYFADFLILSLLIPFSSENTTYKSVAIPSLVISSAALITVIAAYTLTVPYTASDTAFVPIYKIAQYINYESFMSRLESIFTVGWLLSFVMYSSLSLYVASMLMGRVFGAKRYRPFMYRFALVITLLSIIPKNTVQLTRLTGEYSSVRFAAGMCLPIALLLITRFKERRTK